MTTNQTPAIRTIRKVTAITSPCCPTATAVADCEVARGEQTHPLGWTISDGEIVRFHSITCNACGGVQVS